MELLTLIPLLVSSVGVETLKIAVDSKRLPTPNALEKKRYHTDASMSPFAGMLLLLLVLGASDNLLTMVGVVILICRSSVTPYDQMYLSIKD